MSIDKNTTDLESKDNKTPILCDVTLKYILDDMNQRQVLLNNRETTSLNIARQHEILLIQVYLQGLLLANLEKK